MKVKPFAVLRLAITPIYVYLPTYPPEARAEANAKRTDIDAVYPARVTLFTSKLPVCIRFLALPDNGIM